MGRNPRRIVRQDKPPAVLRVVPIVCVAATQRIEAYCCSKTLWGTWTHWDGRRTVPCMTDRKVCGDCQKGLPKRWRGFLLIHEFVRKATFFVELTPLGAQGLLEQLGTRPLRGRRILIRRQRDTKRAPLIVDLLGDDLRLDGLPAPQDPLPTLRRLWGIETLETC